MMMVTFLFFVVLCAMVIFSVCFASKWKVDFPGDGWKDVAIAASVGAGVGAILILIAVSLTLFVASLV